MKVYVVTEQRYDNGEDYMRVCSVHVTLDGAKGMFATIKRNASNWLASKCSEEDFEIDSESERLFSAFDSSTGDYNFEVEIVEQELVD